MTVVSPTIIINVEAKGTHAQCCFRGRIEWTRVGGQGIDSSQTEEDQQKRFCLLLILLRVVSQYHDQQTKKSHPSPKESHSVDNGRYLCRKLGKDVVVCYKTGSGKTLSYLLPVINKLQSHSQIIGARVLILIPTRDLADQITRVLKSFLHKIDLRYSLILGGHTYEGQFESLSINPDIIIATPGRLIQLLA